MKRPTLCLMLLSTLFLSLMAAARCAEISGRVAVVGPPRSVSALQVTLRRITMRGEAPTQEVMRTQPRADGRFAFTHVRPDWYVIEVDGPGVLSGQWGGQGPELAGRALVVRPGEIRDGLRVEVLSRPVLCGQVFGIDGKPAVGAAVSVWRTWKGRGMSMSGADASGISNGGSTRTDRFGRYRFERFNPGYYVVSAYTPEPAVGSPNNESGEGIWKDAQELVSATWIDLSPHGGNDNCPYDIRLHPSPTEPVGPRYRVEGTLVSDLSTISPRAHEWALWAVDPQRWQGSPAPIPFDPARPAFSFHDVPPGKYRLQLRPTPLSTFSGSCFPYARTDVDEDVVVAADVMGLTISTKPVVWIKGQVENVHTALDVDEPSYYSPKQVGIVLNGACTGTDVRDDGSFAFRDLEPGAADTTLSVFVEGAYTSQFVLNGNTTSDHVLRLEPGENSLTIVERFDSGLVHGIIFGRSVDGAQERDQSGAWVGDDEHVLLFDGDGRPFRSNMGVQNGEFRPYLRPGKYTAVAGMNEELIWGWSSPEWDDPRALKILASLGTSFVVEPGKTTTVTLRDRTVEIQNMSAALGLPMNRR